MEQTDLTYEDVLDFWFGGDMKLNYKTKWFPSGNDTLQHEADLLIQSKFGYIFNEAINQRLDHWLNINSKSKLAMIIILDQFSRHIFRLQELSSDNEQRQLADKLALNIAETLISTDSNWFESFTVSQHVFALMPFRHNATKDRLINVLDSINNRELIESESIELMNKFRKQTTRRLQHLEDRMKVSEYFNSISVSIILFDSFIQLLHFNLFFLKLNCLIYWF